MSRNSLGGWGGMITSRKRHMNGSSLMKKLNPPLHPFPPTRILQRSTRGQQEMGDCSPEVLANSSEQQRPSIVKSFGVVNKGEGNGNPLQCSCLENPRNQGAWWAAVYGVTQSRTRLKQLSGGSSSSKENKKKIYIYLYNFIKFL